MLMLTHDISGVMVQLQTIEHFETCREFSGLRHYDVISHLLTTAHALQQGNVVFALCRSLFTDEVKGWGGEQRWRQVWFITHFITVHRLHNSEPSGEK